ncbi:MAG: DNA-binding protein SMUBP-2 [Phylliscum demangeonii]|nr:MAG: DNA-binding protein SMUBP-2 [Phylliscum demangeonii]
MTPVKKTPTKTTTTADLAAAKAKSYELKKKTGYGSPLATTRFDIPTSLSSGVGLPPGTGKTHFITQVTLPLLAFFKEDSGKHRVMALSPTNDLYERLVEKPNGVSDPRVQHLASSLGFQMLRTMGIIPGANTPAEQATYALLREQYAQFGKGILETPEDRATFTSNLHELREYVVAQADVIVTTCSNAAEGFITRSCHPDVLFVDEAAKAVELDLVIPIAFYGPRTVVLVGDEKQLRPTVKTYGKKSSDKKAINCFAGQLAMSTFDRLKTSGYPTVLLREQHRMTAGLAKAASDIIYDGQLIDAPSTALVNRLKSQSFLVWTSTNYPEVRGSLPALLLDIRGSRSARLGRSVFNLDTAAAGINVILGLLQHGFHPTDIAVVCFYQAQCEVYRVALRSATQARQGWTFAGVLIKTVDGFQGGEAPIVILDYAITSAPEGPKGFSVALEEAGLAKNVTRLHAWTTEEDIVKMKRAEEHSKPKINHMIDELDDPVASLDTVVYLRVRGTCGSVPCNQ